MSRRFNVLVSSCVPFTGGHYDHHQTKAVESWRGLTDNLVLFNNPSDVWGIQRVDMSFVLSPNPPTVKRMLEVGRTLAGPDGVIALVNSDIILTDSILKSLDIARDWYTWAATSFRWEDGEVRGQGLDVFIIPSKLVEHILKDIPSFMTVGRTLWDNWMNGWLRRQLPDNRYFNMTPWKCVHHPLHDRVPGRLTPYTDEQVKTIFASGHLDCRGIPPTIYV